MGRMHLANILLLSSVLVAGCGKQDNSLAAKGGADAKGGGAASPAGASAGKQGGAPGRGPRGGGGQKQPVEVTSLLRRDLSESLRVVGSLAANETATIRPEMSGLIREIHFQEGQRVKKGDLLMKLDDAELQAQLAQSEARFELAKLNLARADNLRATQSITQADVDRSRSEFTGAQADLDLLKVRLARTEIRAPFDGVVEARGLSAGDYVTNQSTITTINDLSRMKVEFQVPERYLAKVRRGTPFAVKSTTAETVAPVEGEVYFVNSVISRETRSSEVKGYLHSPPPALKAGMFAMIEIVLEVRHGALAAPEGAILVDQRGPQLVTVVEEKGEQVAALVPVVLGLRSRGLVEVTPVRGEFADPQLIVAAGVGQLPLFPGARLEPRPLREEFQLVGN